MFYSDVSNILALLFCRATEKHSAQNHHVTQSHFECKTTFEDRSFGIFKHFTCFRIKRFHMFSVLICAKAGRAAKNCAHVNVAQLQNIFTQVKEKVAIQNINHLTFKTYIIIR